MNETIIIRAPIGASWESREVALAVARRVWEPIGNTHAWRAEWRGCRVYVRELRFGWNWTWSNRVGAKPLASADEAKTAAQLALCGGPA